MPTEITEQTSTKTISTKWWTPYITPQTMFGICAAFVWAVIFWKDSHDNWDKTNRLEETKANADDVRTIREDLKALRETVTKQYATAKEDREREGNEIEQVADWKHEQEGYWKAMKEMGWPQKFINK